MIDAAAGSRWFGSAHMGVSGSTEVTGASGTESFNVTADQTCSWTITITSAS